MLLNHETYWMNLTEANQKGEANIKLEYHTKVDLGLKDMSPKSWHKYVRHLTEDEIAFDR